MKEHEPTFPPDFDEDGALEEMNRIISQSMREMDEERHKEKEERRKERPSKEELDALNRRLAVAEKQADFVEIERIVRETRAYPAEHEQEITAIVRSSALDHAELLALESPDEVGLIEEVAAAFVTLAGGLARSAIDAADD